MAMIFRRCARLLVAGSTFLAALTGGTGTALANPDAGQQPDIPSIDEWPIQFPTTLTNPIDDDENGLLTTGGGVGMVCENLSAHCG
ncbi:hypothetical protein A5626_09105 [Mycobacterium marseillense]|uniref:Secreted protein n=1 Tax=Mycobacterium marseillense TaxID=701042 RepID=A0AAC9YLG1_9MYCO|nr:hypothetical protein CKJ54_17940 [Mycobacterium marseillense]MCA2264028.1 hypothetical protein [Mycobacterium marseillense]MCV7406020.1 hypothetical protein [Mycobacterium marseillense]OBJ66919.1 hypothetical protein A5626_09105 [Mycobacterium marseillense]ORA88998.1 hypothetical protein BST31_19365 [Mycobacterium marseillense]